MLTQPYLRQLITAAVRIWRIHQADIYRASSREAVRARVAIFHAAYENGCGQSDLVVAFGWSGTGRRNLAPHEVGRAHAGYLEESEYRERFGALVDQASSHRRRSPEGKPYSSSPLE